MFGGTVGIYFYGPPIFPDPACDEIYDRMAICMCRFLLPFQGTPGEPFHRRGAEGLVSFLDSIALPAGDITHDVVGREFWAHEWDADNVKACLDSVYPHYRDQAGEIYAEIEAMREELRAAMGGKQKGTFSVVLILGTRK